MPDLHSLLPWLLDVSPFDVISVAFALVATLRRRKPAAAPSDR